MPDNERITIKVTKEIRLKDGAVWHARQQLRTTHEELKQRGAPRDRYEVIAPPESKTAPAPGNNAAPGKSAPSSGPHPPA